MIRLTALVLTSVALTQTTVFAGNLPTVQRGGASGAVQQSHFTKEVRKGITILRAIPSEQGLNIYPSETKAESPAKLEEPVEPAPIAGRLKYPEMINANAKAAGTKYDSIVASVANNYGALITSAAKKYGVPEALIIGVIVAESAGNRNARSPKGAMGLMQLMPSTATQFGVADAFSPRQNIEGGTALIAELLSLYEWDPLLVLAAYNAGEGNVAKYKGVPPFKETREYIPRVLAAYSAAKKITN